MPTATSLPFLHVDRESPIPIYAQLEIGIRKAILNGTLSPGIRLPASRELARDLGVSRLPVQTAYEQLVMEGFLTSRQGAGTFVAEIPLERLNPERPAEPISDGVSAIRLTQRTESIRATLATIRLNRNRPFRPGIPAMDLFPRKLWARSVRRATARIDSNAFSYGEFSGSAALREQIAQHVRAARGVTCDCDQIVVTAGSQQAFLLLASALLDPGSPVWLEDPGHIAARDTLSMMNAEIHPVPLDREGINLSEGELRYPAPRLIFVTPSRQHPTGTTMSLHRRVDLLRFAAQHRAWVIEDDYDSEFRYRGRPLMSLQGLDRHQVVIYVGSFSKTLFPGLRLGYAVVPRDLVDVIRAAQGILTMGCNALVQAAVADFMAMGHYEAHIHKMRQAYHERAGMLARVLREHARDHVCVDDPEAGMHLAARLNRADPETVCKALWRHGIEALSLSFYAIRARVAPTLVLGFAGATPHEIDAIGKRTAEIIVEHGL